MGVLRYSRTILLSTTFLTPAAAGDLEGTEGASYLLDGEQSGFSIDATTYDTITAEEYEGGPVGGTVSVGTSGVFASDNVALDSSILTQAGTSPKMVHFNSAPYVRWTPHNLAYQSQAFSTSPNGSSGTAVVTANNAVAPDGTMTADTVTFGTDSNDQIAQANTNLLAGRTYTLSGWAKVASGTRNFAFRANDGSSTWSSDKTATTTWQRFEFIYTPNNTSVNVSFPHNHSGSPAAGDLIVWGFQVNRGSFALPYLATTTTARIGIPQAYDAYEDCFGVLVEPAATNICLRSEDLTTTWTNTNTTETSNSIASPDGATTADTLTASSTTGCYIQQSGLTGYTDNGANTVSIYAKKGTSNYVAIAHNYIADATNTGAWFNLDTGAVGTVQSNVTSTTITAVGNGWYRCTITGTNTSSTANDFAVYICDGDNSVSVTNGNNIYLWGAQAETGSVATSYIPTLGSTSTRAADGVSFAHASWPYSTTEDTIYLDMKDAVYSGSNAYIYLGSESTGSPHILGTYSAIYGGAANNWLVTASSDTRWQGTAAFKASDHANSANGGAVQTNGNSQAIVSNSQGRLGGTGAALTAATMMFYRVVMVPRRVIDADLPTWRYDYA